MVLSLLMERRDRTRGHVCHVEAGFEKRSQAGVQQNLGKLTQSFSQSWFLTVLFISVCIMKMINRRYMKLFRHEVKYFI